MKFSLLLVVLCITSILLAQSNEADVQDSTRYIQNPVESPVQHNLQAYELMMAGHYTLALKEYEIALKLNSSDSVAREGILWANNSLHRWKNTITTGQKYLKKFGYDANIELYLAYAYFAKTDYLHARQCYLWSSEYLGWYAANTSGMAWTFRMLGDHTRERKFTRKWEMLVPDSLKAIVSPPPYPLYLGHAQYAYSTWNDNEKSFLQHYTLRYQNIAVTCGVEDIWQNHHLLRTDYLASLNWETPISSMEWRGNWLKGDYSNLYPANSHLISISKLLYVSKTQLVPEINAGYSYYPVLSVSQIAFKQSYIRDSWWFSYSHALIYKDYDSPGLDSRSNWATWDVGTRLLTNLTVDFYTSHGDRTFYVSREIGVVDNNVSAKLQYGAYLQYNYRILNLGCSYSKSKHKDNEYSSTVSVNLGIDYSLKATYNADHVKAHSVKHDAEHAGVKF